MLANAKREDSCSNSREWWFEFSLLNPEKEIPNQSDKIGMEFMAGYKNWVFGWWWLVELALRSIEALDRRLLLGSGGKDSRKKIKKDGE
jgi:hypothetical protein